MIHTVCGEIPPEGLGFTQCHEHLMLRKGQSFLQNADLWFDETERSIEEVLDYKNCGGNSIVEAQPGGCGRMSEELVKISKETGISIIASTGFHKLMFYPERHWIREASAEELIKLYIDELQEGMYINLDDGNLCSAERGRRFSKAGIIKTALDVQGINGPYKDLFIAASAAQKETGSTMMVHIEKGSDPLELVSFLNENGNKPEKIYFCHMDRACSNPEIFQKVLDLGFSLEFDTIGRFKYHSDEYEIGLIKRILDRGYDSQLLISLDTTRARLRSYNPKGVGLTYIKKVFLPEMKEAGITEKQIRKITCENPARILNW